MPGRLKVSELVEEKIYNGYQDREHLTQCCLADWFVSYRENETLDYLLIKSVPVEWKLIE